MRYTNTMHTWLILILYRRAKESPGLWFYDVIYYMALDKRMKWNRVKCLIRSLDSVAADDALLTSK